MLSCWPYMRPKRENAYCNNEIRAAVTSQSFCGFSERQVTKEGLSADRSSQTYHGICVLANTKVVAALSLRRGRGKISMEESRDEQATARPDLRIARSGVGDPCLALLHWYWVAASEMRSVGINIFACRAGSRQ